MNCEILDNYILVIQSIIANFDNISLLFYSNNNDVDGKNNGKVKII